MSSPAPAVRDDDFEIFVAHHRLAERGRARGAAAVEMVRDHPAGEHDGDADAVVGKLLAQHVAVAGDRELGRDVRALSRTSEPMPRSTTSARCGADRRPRASSGRKAFTVFAVPTTLTDSSHCQSSAVICSSGPNCSTPTLAATTLQLPNWSATAAAAASSEARSATSTPRDEGLAAAGRQVGPPPIRPLPG